MRILEIKWNFCEMTAPAQTGNESIIELLYFQCSASITLSTVSTPGPILHPEGFFIYKVLVRLLL